MIRITIEPASIGQRGLRYRVVHEGSVLLDSTRDPLFDACRALLRRGIIGRLEMWRPGKAHAEISVDIEHGARLTVVETATRGPLVARWEQWKEDDANEQAFPAQASEQGVASRGLSVRRGPKNFRASTSRSAA